MIRTIFLTLLASITLSFSSHARSEFISHDLRERAGSNSRDDLSYCYQPSFGVQHEGELTSYITTINVPMNWLDREIYLHYKGLPNSKVYVNDQFLGSSSDARQITEFNLNTKLKNGNNSIRIEYTPNPETDKFEGANSDFTLREVFIYSQPKVRIYDYLASVTADSLELRIILSNSFNVPVSVSVGYDIYSPKDKLVYYNLKDVTLGANQTDTLVFKDYIKSFKDNKWSPENPNLYSTTLYVRKGGIMTEYLGFKLGYRDVSLGDDFEFRAVSYNSALSEQLTRDELKKLKAQGIKTLCPDYPQSYWFYDLCDELGFYVIEQANINCSQGRGDMRVGGTPSNDLDYMSLYLDRVQRMYTRVKNRTCVVAFSLGGKSGNGINMYRAYRYLKELEHSRSVLYIDADWNTDFTHPLAR